MTGVGHRRTRRTDGCSNDSVLNKLNALCFAVLVQFYTDEVYAPVIGKAPVAVQVREGGGDELFLLGCRYRFLGTAEAGTGLGAHFYKDEVALSLSNDVDFTFTTAEVGLANAVALLLEKSWQLMATV